LPQELETIELQQKALNERMIAPDYYKHSVEQQKTDRAQVQTLEQLMTKKFERWAELDQRANQVGQ